MFVVYMLVCEGGETSRNNNLNSLQLCSGISVDNIIYIYIYINLKEFFQLPRTITISH